MVLPHTNLGQAIFAAGGRTYDWGDVLLAAKLSGDWRDLETEIREGLACLARAEDTGEGPSPAEVTAAAQEFRYDRDLLTAQETESWLAERGLTVEAWTGYIERSVLRQEWADELDDIVAECPPAASAVEALIEVEGFCSGWFERFANALAGRAAVYEKIREEFPNAAPPTLSEPVPAETLPGLSEAECRRKLEHLATLEAAFEEYRAQAVTARAVQDELSHHYLDWIRFECRSVTFADEQMAREAVLSVREDGRDLAAVAEEARVTVEETSFYLDEVEDEFRDRFIAGKTGDLLGPFQMDGEFVIFEVLSKRTPSVDDPQTRERAAEAAWESVTRREMARRIHWHQPL